MTHSHVSHDSFIHTCGMTYWYVCHDSFTCVNWLIHLHDMTHSSARHDSWDTQDILDPNLQHLELKEAFGGKVPLIVNRDTQKESSGAEDLDKMNSVEENRSLPSPLASCLLSICFQRVITCICVCYTCLWVHKIHPCKLMCMYVYTHAFTHIYTHTHTYIHTRTGTRTHTHTHTHTHARKRAHTQRCVFCRQCSW